MMPKLLTIVLAAALLCGAAESTPLDINQQLEAVRSAQIDKMERSAREALVANVTVQLLCTAHYSRHTMTPQLSARWYTSYFELLDPSKIYFLSSDVEEFRGYEERLWNQQTKEVNLDFAYAVYERFLERLREWVLFSAAQFDVKPDFSQEEFITTGRDTAELTWPENAEQQRDVWRRRVKNALLIERLNQEEKAAIEKLNGDAPAPKRVDFRTRSKKNLVSAFRRRLEAEPIDVLENYLNSFANLLDPHSAYLKPASKEQFDISMRLSLQGIGATLSVRDSYVTVISLVPGGPAARDGNLRPGDRIVAVAQSEFEEPVDLIDMSVDKAVQYIRGKKGTDVFLTVLPEGSTSEYILKLVRDEIKLKDAEVQSTLLKVPVPGRKDARVLQLYVPSFYSDFSGHASGKADYKNTTNDLLKLLHEAQAGGAVDGIILDLRGNGGGALDEAVRMAGCFVDDMPVVQVKYQRGRIRMMEDLQAKAVYKGPLMVLVDRFSASASEIVAAFLQDSGRAVVVGDHSTHGKGTVQNVMDLANTNIISQAQSLLGGKMTGSVKTTIGKFYRINGASTQERGVTPDIVFPSFVEWMGTGEAKLPNVLPWDEIATAKYKRLTGLDGKIPVLQEFAQKYMAENPQFQKYASEVEQFRQLREIKELPLEIGARRKYRHQDIHSVKMVRRYQAQRKNLEETQENSLKDEDEVLWEDDPEQRVDIILDASIAIMGRFLSLEPPEAAAK